MDRYYLQTKRSTSLTSYSNKKSITRNSPIEEIFINENVDIPSISIDIDRLKSKKITRPQNDEWDKFKEITEEDFNNYLSVSIDALKTFRYREAEIYFDKPYSSKYEIVLFSADKKNSFRFNIDVTHDLEWGGVKVYCSNSFAHRKHYRQHAMPISSELFEYIKLKTFEYLEDDRNYLNNFKDYLKLIDLSFQGKIKPVFPEKSININPLITELSNQIRHLESRLMHTDNDVRETREKLRGRIEGLKSAIFEITNFFSAQN